MNRMKFLVNELNKHVYNYYVLDKPVISDSEYDKMYDELVELERKTGTILKNSPTQKVGGDILPKFKKYKHDIKLFSLDKCQNADELEKWIKNIKTAVNDARFTIEYKFDGLRLVLKYNNGQFISAGTRGNGSVGEDVTEQVKTIKSVPLSIPFKGEVIVEGEGMITLSNLAIYNKTTNEFMKNARNAAAGAIRNLDPKITAKRRVDFFAYDIHIIGEKIKNQQEVHKFLIENGFRVADYFKTVNEVSDIINEINYISNIKSKLDILMDGLVIKLDQILERMRIGGTSKFPKWAIAYKFPPEETTSILRDVVWQVGRTGKLTPIAIIDPVELAGATITRATLNNEGDIKRKKVRIGSRVFIRRSNEVIPEILGLAEDLEGSQVIQSPQLCPSCNSLVVKKGANLFCSNNGHCLEQVIDKIVHFAGKEGMNIEGFSKKTALKFYNELNIDTPYKLYSLTKKDLINLENFKDKRSQNLLRELEKSKSVNLKNFIYALGINNVGIKTAKDLAKNFISLESIKSATIEQLNQIKDIGDVVALSIFEYFKNEENLNLIKNLFEVGIVVNDDKKTDINQKHIFTEKVFVLTGTLSNYSRTEATQLIEDNGGKVNTSVSKNVNYVLAGENPGSKLVNAQKLGVKIIDENEFLKLLNK